MDIYVNIYLYMEINIWKFKRGAKTLILEVSIFIKCYICVLPVSITLLVNH